MASRSPEPVWMGTPEAARRLGVTLRTLRRFIEDGRLPAYKMGRVIRVQQADLDAFVDASRIQPRPAGPGDGAGVAEKTAAR